jgi:transposase
MTKPLSPTTRQGIIYLKEKGKTTREIAKIVGCSPSSVSRVSCGTSPSSPSTRSGRKRKLDGHDERYISRLATTGKCETAPQLQRELRDNAGISVSRDTILRTLRRNNINSRFKKKSPQLDKKHKRARREFDKSHKMWTSDQWAKVIFSDETRICVSGSGGRARCFRREGERLQDHHIFPTTKFGGGSLMLWGCMISSGPGFLCRIDGGMIAEMYQSILGDELLRTIDWYGLDRGEIIFQHDNATPHTEKDTVKWFKNNGIKLMKWPAHSPDLNPIEHLWDILKRKVRALPQARNTNELWERVQDAWNSITAGECKNLVDSMPRRLAALRKAKGGSTGY